MPALLHLIIFVPIYFLTLTIRFASASLSDFSIVDYEAVTDLFHGDYSPPAPPPPSPPPHPPSLSCHNLTGIGSLNTTCELNYSLNFTSDVYIEGTGNLFILEGVTLTCPFPGCSIEINITGELKFSPRAEIVAGSIYIVAGNATLGNGSVLNVTALGGEPPGTTGTPGGSQGDGGGHGGRGASCVMDNKKLPEDVWGGDAYAWASLAAPWSYGSKGGTTNKEEDYGGKGGGRIWLEVKDIVHASGLLVADGGDGGIKGGGGSGGSIYIKTHKM